MDGCLERLGKAFSNSGKLNSYDLSVEMYDFWEVGAFGEDFDYKSLGKHVLEYDTFYFDDEYNSMHELTNQLKGALLSDVDEFSFDLDNLGMKNLKDVDKLLDYSDLSNASYMFIAPLFDEVTQEDFRMVEKQREQKTYQYLDNGVDGLFDFKIKTSYNLFVGNRYLGTADNLKEAVKLVGDYVHGVFSELGSYFRERISSKIVEVCEKTANAAKVHGGYWDEVYDETKEIEEKKWGYSDALEGLGKFDELMESIEAGNNMSTSEFVKRASDIMQTYCDTFIENLNKMIENENEQAVVEKEKEM